MGRSKNGIKKLVGVSLSSVETSYRLAKLYNADQMYDIMKEAIENGYTHYVNDDGITPDYSITYNINIDRFKVVMLKPTRHSEFMLKGNGHQQQDKVKNLFIDGRISTIGLSKYLKSRFNKKEIDIIRNSLVSAPDEGGTEFQIIKKLARSYIKNQNFN